MGLILKSVNHEFEIGYGGFKSLRKKVAELCGTEVSDLYKEIDKGILLEMQSYSSKAFWEEHNKSVTELIESGALKDEVAGFLYTSDTKGNLDTRQAKELYKLAKDCDDYTKYGYSGKDNCFTFKDFKNMLEDSISTNSHIVWG